VTRILPSEAIYEEIELNGTPGIVVRLADLAVVAILTDTDGKRIGAVFAVANPDKLDAVRLG
jgi:hypothetical protein